MGHEVKVDLDGTDISVDQIDASLEYFERKEEQLREGIGMVARLFRQHEDMKVTGSEIERGIIKPFEPQLLHNADAILFKQIQKVLVCKTLYGRMHGLE